MAAPFVAEIRMFACNFAPTGWAFCNGQLLPISQNTALFALLGTMYGGDGKSTFALPNLDGRAVCGAGQGPGMGWIVGQEAGSAVVTLIPSEVPAHTHATLNAYSQTAAGTGSATPVGGGGLSFLAATTTARTFNNTPNTTLSP